MTYFTCKDQLISASLALRPTNQVSAKRHVVVYTKSVIIIELENVRYPSLR